jgi:predicted RNA-binding Zn-ribbon protein involved in translation (DUF1610 family)
VSIVTCEDCNKPIDSDLDIECFDDLNSGIVRCKSCRENRDEAAYDRQQEKLMENGGVDDSAYRRDMKFSGRGYLLK